MEYRIECKTGEHRDEFEADKKAVDAARDMAVTQNLPCTVWRKVATITPALTTEVTMHTGDGK
jgi:hypothetical protein